MKKKCKNVEKMIDLCTQYPIITNKHVYTCIVAISRILFSSSTSFEQFGLTLHILHEYIAHVYQVYLICQMVK